MEVTGLHCSNHSVACLRSLLHELDEGGIGSPRMAHTASMPLPSGHEQDGDATLGVVVRPACSESGVPAWMTTWATTREWGLFTRQGNDRACRRCQRRTQTKNGMAARHGAATAHVQRRSRSAQSCAFRCHCALQCPTLQSFPLNLVNRWAATIHQVRASTYGKRMLPKPYRACGTWY